MKRWQQQGSHWSDKPGISAGQEKKGKTGEGEGRDLCEGCSQSR